MKKLSHLSTFRKICKFVSYKGNRLYPEGPMGLFKFGISNRKLGLLSLWGIKDLSIMSYSMHRLQKYIHAEKIEK